MAHPAEPMDIDNIDSDFDNKENTFHHINVQPCTEKGYEELDVSELNMRLRYSVTPAASPMSKSYSSYVDRSLEPDDSLNITVNDNLTRSLNATLTKNDSVVKSLKSLPLQSLPTDQSVERNTSVLRQLDSTITGESNITVTVSGTNDIDENLSSPSSSSSAVPTPEATTPTNNIPKSDGGSPIMRGLKSVLNMFRSSQSPIPPPENEAHTPKQLTPTPTKRLSSEPTDKAETKAVLASTPISTHRERDGNGSKRNSPLKDSITFNDDLEKELQWKDETTILFSQEKIPIHKLFYQQKQIKVDNKINEIKTEISDNLNNTVEYMDISYNDSEIKDRTMTEFEQEITKNEFHIANESDSEFLDCEAEANATKIESYIMDNKAAELNKEESNGTKESIRDLTLTEENDTVSMAVINKEEDKSFTSFNQKENTEILNKSIQNLKENDLVSQIKTKEESCIEKLQPNSKLNLNVTMTIDDQENKNSKDNVMEVSTLESHTKSLSSLIESLDVTKSFDEENINIEANNTLDLTTTLNVNTVNLEISNLETVTAEKPEQIFNSTTNPNVNITIIHQENKLSDINNPPEVFTLNLSEYLSSSAIQNFDITAKMDKQEEPLKHEVSQAVDKLLTVEPTHNAANTTYNINNENKDDLALPSSSIQHLQDMTQETRQVIDKKIEMETQSINESPANIPLPDDDDDLEKDFPINAGVSVTNNVPYFSDVSIAKTEVNVIIESAVEAVLNMNTNERSKPDMILETKVIKNDTEVTYSQQMEVPPIEVDATEGKKHYSEDGNELEEHIQDVTANDEVKNTDATFHVQMTTVHQNVDKMQILPDVVNQSMNESRIISLGMPDSQNIASGNGINKNKSNTSANYENQSLSSNNEQEKNEYCDIQNNIEPTITLPDIQMETSISTCEEILDKNREISEVFLTEEKIDKLQHASDVASNYQKIKDESPPVCDNTDKNETHPINMNTILKKILTDAGHSHEVETDITALENKVVSGAVQLEEHINSKNIELKDISQHELDKTKEIKYTEKVKLAENETTAKSKTVEIEAKIIDNLETCDAEEIIVHNMVNGSNILETDKIDDHQNENKVDTVVKDIKIVIDEQKGVVTQESQEKDLIKKTEENKNWPLNLNDAELEVAIAEDEIIVSGNNSPYVSVAADLDKVSEDKPLDSFEEIDDPLISKTNIPSSPPITSKGYNFNFDEIDDPFASNVKIRMSPTPESPNKTAEIKKEDNTLSNPEIIKKNINKNRRRSQPTRQKLSNTKKVFNATFEGSVNVPEIKNTEINTNMTQQTIHDIKVDEKQISPVNSSNDIMISSDIDKNVEKVPEVKNVDVVDAEITSCITLPEQKLNDLTKSEENKDSIESLSKITNEIKTTSSSEQSTYFSAGTSSSESIKSKNVFNLPEIDDMNFNPFTTKSKIRKSPPRDVDMDNPFATKSKIMNSPDSSMIMQIDKEDQGGNTTINVANNSTENDLEDKMETEPMEKDSSGNISNNTTNSSKATDRDVTVREVNTEDEDTIEGPFLEAEDLEDKHPELDGENDMMQFNDLPVSEHDENADGELFIDAEAFEFLLNQNKSNVVADSGKESLFLKFDPLFAKRMSCDSVAAALSRAQKRQSTPTRTPRQQRSLPKSVAGPSTMNLTYEADTNANESTEDVNITVSKPMMVVTPAVNPSATLRKSVTPTRTNRRSITFTSPAMAVIDRLLSLSANNSFAEQESVPQVSREQNEAELALTQLREVLAEKEIHVYNLRSESKELKDRLAILESQMKLLETDGQQRLKKINDLNEKLIEKTKMNKSMAVVVEEYERTIASLIAETEQDKKRHAEERIALMNERDEQTAHLASMEVSFNDLHSKYEKSKQVIMNYKANEESYKQSLKAFEENVSKMQKNYELLKQHATSKLNHANEELQKINRSHESEVLKLNAMIKRKELHITSLEETLAQKTKANEELTAICDELINKVG